MADEIVRSRFEAETSGYVRGVETAAKATDRLAQSADKAGAGAKRLEQAQRQAAAAQDRAADAAGRLRVAQEKLNQARDSKDVGRIVAAEESVAKAQRDVERTAQEAATAQSALQKGLDATAGTADEATTRMGRLSKAVTANRDDLERAGTAMLTLGAGITALSVGAGKAAMDWESAWAGVLKTNDGTSEQIQQLEGDLRGLAKTLPATHSEIAAVAEAAGQLGVGIDDVSSFTKVMIDLGESTNLSAEEAATSIARFANITGLALSDVDQLGSALVGLGNNFATTESEIMMMSMRVAAVGTQVGLTEGEILGLATAMSSVGVEAEAGGTAISMVMKKIDASVREGGDSLTGWAEAAGVSAQEFAAAWQNEPAAAMETLVTGLGETAAAGGDVNGMLADLGVKGVRESDTLLRLASAGELLGDSFATGNEEMQKNSALVEEASKRYETAESKIRIAWNNIRDAAIDAGAAILPVFAGVAEGVASIAQGFGALPGPVKGALGALGALAGVGLLATGGLMALAPRVLDTMDSFKRLNVEFPKTAGFMGKLAKGAGLASAAFIGFEVLKGIANDSVPAAKGIEQVANSLLQLGEGGGAKALDDLFSSGQSIQSFGDALRYADPSDLETHMESFGATVLGLHTPAYRANEQFKTLGQTLATMDSETAAGHFRRMREEAEASGSDVLSSWEGLKKVMPEYAASVEAASNATGKSADAATLYGIAMGHLPAYMINTSDAAEQAKSGTELFTEALSGSAEAAQELDDALKEALNGLREMGIVPRNAQAANDAYQASLDALTASVKENGQTLDATTEKGRANREALRSHTDAGLANAAAMAEAGASQGEVSRALMDMYESTMASADAMGLSKGEAELYAKELLGIPTDVDVDVESYMDTKALEIATLTGAAISGIPVGVQVLADMSPAAAEQAFKTAEAIKVIPEYKRVDVAVDDQGTPGQIQERINQITGSTEHVFVTEDGTAHNVQEQILRIDGKDVPVYVKDDGTVVITQSKIKGIQGKDVGIKVTDNGTAADVQRRINQIAGKAVKVTANVQQSVTRVFKDVMGGFEHGGVAGVGGFPHRTPTHLPGHAMGRLPYTGLGTDRILGVNADGWPVARVNDGEGIIKETSTRKHLSLLGMVNDDDPRVSAVGRMLGLPGYQSGRVGREWSAASVAPVQVSTHATAAVDTGQIATAVASAIRGWQPVVKLGRREVHGVMVEAGRFGGDR